MKSVEDYNRKYHANVKHSGYGFDTATHHPCPGCAEPDWMVARLMDTQTEIEKEHVCKHCGRGFKGVMTYPNPATMHLEMVQTCGEDLPDWYFPKMRRV